MSIYIAVNKQTGDESPWMDELSEIDDFLHSTEWVSYEIWAGTDDFRGFISELLISIGP